MHPAERKQQLSPTSQRPSQASAFQVVEKGYLLLQPWLELMQDMVHVVLLLLSDTVSACGL